MGRPKKDKFADLNPEFKTLIDNAKEDDIRKKISEVALNEADNQEAKAADEDLANQKAKAKEAGAQYAEATAANKSAIAYAKYILRNMGKHAELDTGAKDEVEVGLHVVSQRS